MSYQQEPDKFVDFLLPSGILLQLQCKDVDALSSVKEKLWEEAKQFPLFGLRQPEWYTLVFVNRQAQQEECLDESQKLGELQMYQPLFKVVEKKGDRDEKMLSTKIAWLLGKGSLKEFETNRNPEVSDFRLDMVEKCKRAIEFHNGASWEERVSYCYPSEIDPNSEKNRLIDDRMQAQEAFNVAIHASGEEQKEQRYVLRVPPTEKVVELLDKAVKRYNRTLGPGKEQAYPENYVLKVNGMEEYLTGDYSLLQFKHVKKSISRGSNPILSLITKSMVEVDYPCEEYYMPSLPKMEKPKIEESVCLWDTEGLFSLKVVSAGNLNVSKDASIQVLACVYHGDEQMCQMGTTRAIQLQDVPENTIWHWNENINFDIDVKDIPRGARLCIGVYALYGTNKKAKKKTNREEKVPLAWVNQPLFDYKGVLRSGTETFPCWTINPEEPLDDLPYPIGTVMLNPNAQDSPSVMLRFKDYARVPVVFPKLEYILEIASKEMENYLHQKAVPKAYETELKEIVDKDPLQSMFEQDKELVWQFRMHLLEHMPASLPKLLNSVKWNHHKDVAVLLSILQAWRPLPPVQALELLDYAYQDPNVRDFAVRCLQSMSDTDVSQYLLQMCQALKYESYLNCPLAQFLLERAFKNKRIGHYLFWNMKAEIDCPESSLRFGLILESYLRGCPNHLVELQRQVDGMAKMKNITELMQQKRYRERDKRAKAREDMRSLLSEPDYRQVMCNCVSILNPKLKLGDMKVSECKFYDSKMRPLLLVYDNPDVLAVLKDVRIMFKHGDDLRQDMLTLQILNIMDNMWQEEGLDLRLLPYGCLSTGNRVGFIEIVRRAETIANIQKNEKSSKAKLWDSSLLYNWLKEKNPTEPQLQKAAEAFYRSCAGYCVATYVLGIGDRHSDNIMITEGGQLFHIDFGHFLGNFKVKFGYRRERVPFVLAKDFEIIIDKHFGFETFVQLCEDAYLILRRRAALFINLFAMMLQTGIPELRSVEDINYVRDALVLGVTEKEAKEHFHAKLQESRKNSFHVSMNWFLHGLAKDNRQ